ncbi:unnamed protein product [Ambrosiozyma monospora]|uniref:Unnamed protein product n=1 Tax=Ambrosiozyma monospora TaxID=43982 RepID=A0ACB5TAA2_AMBMO|nr:unnamed protein product [Ambrosiozyma monospora]
MSIEMEIDSPSLNDTTHDSQLELLDSPLLNIKTCKKNSSSASASLGFAFKKSSSLKRPLTASPSIDSPTCSGLAADFSTNFHVNNHHYKMNNPKKLLLPSILCNATAADDEDEEKENRCSSSASSFFFNNNSSNDDNCGGSALRRTNTLSRKLNRKSSMTHFKSNSLSSSFYHSRSASSSAVLFPNNNSINKKIPLSLKVGNRAPKKTGCASNNNSHSNINNNNNNTHMDSRIDQALEKAQINEDEDEQDQQQRLVDPTQLTPRSFFKSVSLDSLALPTPVREKLDNVSYDFSPETQSVMMNGSNPRLNLKKSFSMLSQSQPLQRKSYSTSSSSSSSSSEEEDDDFDSLHFNPVLPTIECPTDSDDDDIVGDEDQCDFGSPLQQRAHNRNRVELNANLRGQLQRALSCGPTSSGHSANTLMCDRPRPLLNLSTTSLPNNNSTSSLSAGTSQLTRNISGLSFRMSPSEKTFCDHDNSVLDKTDIKTFKI